MLQKIETALAALQPEVLQVEDESYMQAVVKKVTLKWCWSALHLTRYVKYSVIKKFMRRWVI